jgi:hypothetical protein
MTPPFQRLLLPLGPTVDQEQVLLPATVLSTWLDVPLQILCEDPEYLPRYRALVGGLGIAVEPVLCLEEPFTAGVVAHANANGPSLIITTPDADGLALAKRSSQPVLITADRTSQRLPVGPLVVEVTGDEQDLDALALSAVLSPALGEPIRLIVGTTAGTPSTASTPSTTSMTTATMSTATRTTVDGPSSLADYAAAAEQRLTEMGCEVGVDALRAHGLHPLVLVGRTRSATAMVIPANRLDEPGLIERATTQGVNVIVAPPVDGDAGRPPPFRMNLDRPVDHRSDGADLQVLDRDECMARLERHTVARIGYVDTGWPTVVPVNYRVQGGDIYMRSLAGAKLKAAERGDTVCLELDGYDEALRTGWSVIAHGALEVIHDAATLRQAWTNDPHPWVAAPQWRWLRMVPFSVSGRTVAPGTEGTDDVARTERTDRTERAEPVLSPARSALPTTDR